MASSTSGRLPLTRTTSKHLLQVLSSSCQRNFEILPSPDPQPNMVGTFPSSQLGAGSKSLDIGCSASSSVRPMKFWLIGGSQDNRQHQQGAYLSIMEYRY